MTLPEVLLDESRRETVVTESIALIDSEVAAKRGVTGFAIKSGYKIVKKLDGGKMLPKAVNDLLPEFAAALEPFHAAYRAQAAGNFASFGTGKERELANALLAITDGKAEHAKNAVLKKVYYKLRPSAVTHLIQSMPPVTVMIDRHAG